MGAPPPLLGNSLCRGFSGRLQGSPCCFWLPQKYLFSLLISTASNRDNKTLNIQRSTLAREGSCGPSC